MTRDPRAPGNAAGGGLPWALPTAAETTTLPAMDELELRELLEFYQLGEQELDTLATLRPMLESAADEFVSDFYRHLISFKETQLLLVDPELKERLLGAQRDYLLSLADPVVDDAYIEKRRHIGTTHERVGLQLKWYFGAFALYATKLLPIVAERHQDDPVATERTSSALIRRLFLDSLLATEQYMQRRQADVDRLNEELRAAGLALSKEVSEKTRSLKRTEARARAAEELASVATLVTGLAHEIGTPMGVIRGHAEALEGSIEDERGRWRMQMIRDQIDRITSIIQSLLNIARPRESLHIEIDLPALVETTLGFLSEKIRRRSVRVETRFEELPQIAGDPEKIQQMLLNLFINALDAMPDGGTLRVALECVGEEVLLRTSDTGFGIPDDKLQHIFDPFYTTKAAGRGSGLGLVVVKGIVSDHGGQIEASSRTGQGTEFLVRLPFGGRNIASDTAI